MATVIGLLISAAALGVSTAQAAGAFDSTPTNPEKATRRAEAEAKRQAAAESRLRKGRAASILTGGQGVTEQATLGQHSLLGGP